MKKIHKILTYCLVGSFSFLASTAAKAEEIPVAGINVALSSIYEYKENANSIITQILENSIDDYKGLSFAKVSNYVNIRRKPGEESEIVGKLYNNSAATIIEKEGDWYKIKSGSVNGYIKADYLITGEAAQELEKKLGTRVAKVKTATLNVRKQPNTNATIITQIPKGDEFEVNKEQGEWIEIILSGNQIGYVATMYVDLTTKFEEAVSIEEERQRLQEEEEANRREQVSQTRSRNTTSRNQTVQKKTTASQGTSAAPTGTSARRDKIVSYALKFNGNPYVWGGTSLTNGADCSGFTQSVFRDNGISIPRTSRTQASSGRRVPLDQIRPGDLIFYTKNGTINHVAIYIGNGKVISASSPKTGIKITNYNYRKPYKAVSYLN